jgi:hypothetical protein
MGRQEGRQMGRQDAPLGAPLLCSELWVSPKGPPMIDRGRLDVVVTRTLQLDLDALPIRDRAALRLLARADAGTASQLARLIYRRERTAQERVLQLTRAGALARMTDPRSGRGTAVYAYRPSPATRTRRGIREPRANEPLRVPPALIPSWRRAIQTHQVARSATV